MPGAVPACVFNSKLHCVDEFECVFYLLFHRALSVSHLRGFSGRRRPQAYYASVTEDVQKVVISVYVGTVASP